MCVRAQSLPSRRPLQSLVNDEPQMEISIVRRDVIRFRRIGYLSVPDPRAVIGSGSEILSPLQFNLTSVNNLSNTIQYDLGVCHFLIYI
jgi:hypothetical protein